MILPIRVPFNAAGLPGQGVPAFTADESSAAYYPAAADTAGSGDAPDEALTNGTVSAFDAAVPSGVPSPSDIADAGGGQTFGINTGALRQTHGESVWRTNRLYRFESDFDKWRRAGRPTACRGVGDWSSTIQAIAQAGAAGAAAASLPPGTIVQTGPTGTVIIPPGGAIPVSGGQVVASASPAAWLLGIAAVGVLVFVAVNR